MTNKKFPQNFVGMPAAIMLEEFGSQVWSAFGTPPYLTGSSLYTKKWRDVDVRLILSDEEYEQWGFGNPIQCHQNGKWVSLCLAFSALGKQITSLPIDFQIQQRSKANRDFKNARFSLGNIDLRIIKK